jgi:hypothetical protein
MTKGTTKPGFVNVNNQEVIGASTSTANHPYAKATAWNAAIAGTNTMRTDAIFTTAAAQNMTTGRKRRVTSKIKL